MKALELRIPPPVVAAIVAALMWWAASFLSAIEMASAPRLSAALALALLGLGFDIAGLVSFRRARTTVNPMRPEVTSALVTAGVYRLTRNPMYLGLFLVLVAWAVFLSSFWLLAGPLVFLLYMNRFQIAPEERVLSAAFPDDYAAYSSRVRRWL